MPHCLFVELPAEMIVLKFHFSRLKTECKAGFQCTLLIKAFAVNGFVVIHHTA